MYFLCIFSYCETILYVYRFFRYLHIYYSWWMWNTWNLKSYTFEFFFTDHIIMIKCFDIVKVYFCNPILLYPVIQKNFFSVLMRWNIYQWEGLALKKQKKKLHDIAMIGNFQHQTLDGVVTRGILQPFIILTTRLTIHYLTTRLYIHIKHQYNMIYIYMIIPRVITRVTVNLRVESQNNFSVFFQDLFLYPGRKKFARENWKR